MDARHSASPEGDQSPWALLKKGKAADALFSQIHALPRLRGQATEFAPKSSADPERLEATERKSASGAQALRVRAQETGRRAKEEANQYQAEARRCAGELSAAQGEVARLQNELVRLGQRLKAEETAKWAAEESAQEKERAAAATCMELLSAREEIVRLEGAKSKVKREQQALESQQHREREAWAREKEELRTVLAQHEARVCVESEQATQRSRLLNVVARNARNEQDLQE